jgi:hypothetical protein
MNIILRKVRGIPGLTPLFRPVGSSVAASSAFTPVFSPVKMLGMITLLIVALLFVAVLTFLTPGHALASPAHSLMAMPVLGNLAVKLKDKQDAISAKQKTMHEVFEAAGKDVDFTKPSVLTLVGAKDSAEAVEKVKTMNRELDALGKERDELAELKGIADANDRRRSTPATTLPFPGEGDREDRKARKSFGQMVVESKAVQEARASLHLSKDDQQAQSRQGISSLEKGFGLPELKATFITSSGWSPESLRVPGLVIDKATRPIQVLDIIPTASTDMAAVKYMEETTRTHAGAERAENASYAESSFVLTERSETVRSIGESVPVTDEQLEDVAGTSSYLDQRLQFGVRQRLDGQVIIGDGNAPNLTGIKNKAGIQTQAKGVDPAPDAIYKAMVLVRVTGRAFPNAVVIHPNNWQTIRLMRTADGLYIWGSPSDTGADRIWGIQAVQSDADAAGTAYVGDYANFCALYERKGIEVAVGYVNNDFLQGRRTIRAGLRVAFAIYRAAAFCSVTGLL